MLTGMARRESRAALSARVWRAMFDVLMRSAPPRTRSRTRRGLTPNDSRALFSLDGREGRPMRSLAEAWQCDPSNTTWIVDRLEKLGLAERRAVAEDRRIKHVVLTAQGARTRAELMDEFHSPPPEVAGLARPDLQCLHRVLPNMPP